MIILTFKTPDGLRIGIKTTKGVIDVWAAYQALCPHLDIAPVPQSPEALFAQGLPLLPVLRNLVRQALSQMAGASWVLDEADLVLGPCVPRPGKILCVGRNYRRHAAETGAEPPPVPLFFAKFNNAIAAPGEPIPMPAGVFKYDYEVELAVVMGKRARDVAEEIALDYVLGYCNANDVSARDLQSLTGQWLIGKTLDKFLPLGPYVVTADEIPDPQALSLRCWLNGELRQEATTSDMIFPVAQLISYASQYMTLEAGDVIVTGTPEGVILGRSEKVWMKAGDEVTVEVGPLGRLTNVMVDYER